MRPVRTIAALLFATVGMLTLHAAPAWAGPATLQVSPNPATAGNTVTLSGTISPVSDCAGGLTLVSEGFVHTHDFAGLPAVFAHVTPGRTFTAKTTVPRSKAAGSYAIRGRCGGGNLGVLATLAVRAGHTTSPVALRVSPRSVVAGHAVTVSGSVGRNQAGSECASGVTLLWRAFVNTHEFAGVPAVGAAVRRDGTFAATTTIPRPKAVGTYTITGRCGGGNLGASATLTVRAKPVTDPGPPAAPSGPDASAAPDAPSATSPSVTKPAAAAPAVDRPPAPPATPAVSQGAGRGIIPALVALGVWLLYRRRYPAGPGR
jgi:hypothetical protein